MADKLYSEACVLKQVCVPKEPARKIMRSVFEGARDMARDIAKTDDYAILMRQRKKVEMLFAHLKRITQLDRLRLRGSNGARDEFHIAATAHNLCEEVKLIPNSARDAIDILLSASNSSSTSAPFHRNRPIPEIRHSGSTA